MIAIRPCQLAEAEECHPIQLLLFNDCLQIAHPGVERKLRNIAVGQSTATHVVSDERDAGRQLLEELSRHRLLPL